MSIYDEEEANEARADDEGILLDCGCTDIEHRIYGCTRRRRVSIFDRDPTPYGVCPKCRCMTLEAMGADELVCRYPDCDYTDRIEWKETT